MFDVDLESSAVKDQWLCVCESTSESTQTPPSSRSGSSLSPEGYSPLHLSSSAELEDFGTPFDEPSTAPINLYHQHYHQVSSHFDVPETKSPDEFTLRAVLVGLIVGILLCFTNTYFGLQTGWVTMGSIQAAVVGFAMCKLFLPKERPLTPLENVVLQTVSVATATMPLTAGFVGIIPALQMLEHPVALTWRQQLLWCGALTYFGVFVAVPLRRQSILKEKLPFPSGTATANVIECLHAKEAATTQTDSCILKSRWLSLIFSFCASFSVALVCFIWPPISVLPVGTWIGLPALSQWFWTFRPTLSYIGQGIIMGPRPVFSMLAGALIAWALLGPFASRMGWAPGEVNSWKDGAQGWLLWVAIGLMLGEALSSFLLNSFREFHGIIESISLRNDADQLEVAPVEQLVPTHWWMSGACGSLVAATAIISPLLSIPVWQSLVGVSISSVTSVLAVRALGQTDLNPVSGVGKLSQLIFAVVAPGQLVTNIVAGALVEASAQQAGDVMQAMKTGHLMGSSPRAQFYATLIGSTASVFVSVGAFQMYQSIYGIPSAQFQVPVAHVWLRMGYLMKEGVGALPSSALLCAAIAACIGVMLPLLEHVGEMYQSRFRHYIPSGVAMGIGMYLTPDWTLPRVVGVVTAMAWNRMDAASHRDHHVMVASGFVLGEVMMSICALFFKMLFK